MAISGRSFRRVVAAARTPSEVTINNFNGVDLSSPTLQINSSRAAESVNFLKEDGINQKRSGLTNVWNYYSLTEGDVKGVFSFTDSSGTKRLIVATGDVLRAVTNFGEGNTYVNGDYSFSAINDKNNNLAQFSTNENFVSGWVAGSKLYILYPGSYYVVVYYNANAIGGARLVAESLANNFDLTYQPLTRFGIAAEGSSASFPAGIAYDDFNLLTMWKKNSFRTGTFTSITNNPWHTSTFYKYNLDSKVSTPAAGFQNTMSNTILNIKYLETNTLKPLTYSNWVSSYLSTFQTSFSSPISGDVTTKRTVYTTSSSGRDFLTSDIVFRYRLSTSNYTNYFTTDTFTPGVTVYWDLTAHPYATFPYPQVATSTNRVVIDVRQAVAAGYLGHQNTTSNGNRLFHVLKGDNGGFNVSVSIWTTYQYLGNPVTSSAITYNNGVNVSVVTPLEFTAYQVQKELSLTPSFIGPETATFSTTVNGNNCIVANLHYGNDDDQAYLQIPYNTSGNPKSFLGESSMTEFYPPVLGVSNMELTYPLYVEGYTDKVVKNKFGKLFGYNGAKNRLFLAGNPDQKNVTQRSSPVNFYTQRQGNVTAVDEDLTYFSDLDYNIVGATDNAITGLEVLSDNKLLVLKEDNKEDATIFTISANVIDATAYDGSSVVALDGTNLKEELYLADTGNIGDGLTNHRLLATLNGDTLFLSKLGVRGVVAEKSLPTAPRSSVSRSESINKVLRENYGFADSAAMTTHKGKVYLYLNGTIYVADEDYRTDRGEYEWWILKSKEIIPENGVSYFDNFKIKNFFEFDGELYFYDTGKEVFASGYNTRFYKFIDKQYVDKKIQQYSNANITYTFDAYTPATNNGVLSINSAITPLVTLDKYIAFRYETYNFIGHLNSWTPAIDGYNFGVMVSTANPSEIVVGKKFRVTAAGSTIKGNYYIVSEVGPIQSIGGNPTQLIKFTDLNGNLITSISGWGWGGPVNIATVIPAGTELKVKTIDEGNDEITVFGDFDQTLRFTYLHAETPNREFYVVEKDNVSCYYITSPFNFNTFSDLKTIQKFILFNDGKDNSYVEIEYLASSDTNTFKYIGKETNTEFLLNNLSFDYLYLGSARLPVPFSVRVNQRNIQSIMFKFKNNKDNNAYLTNLTMLYYLTKKVR